MDNSTKIAAIKVAVHPDATGKVSRFYNGTNFDILHELLQNARRAGASRVDVEVDEKDGGTIAVRDDGAGITDYQAVLDFGRSEWVDDAVGEEDPAGMGLFSLARRRWSITSRSADGEPWTVNLGPEHFDGGASATVRRADKATPIGTTIRFSMSSRWTRVAEMQVANVARYYPLPVFVNGEEAHRSPFLEGAQRREEWKGIVFGAYRSQGHGELNFHGVMVSEAGLPRAHTVSEGWSLRVERTERSGARVGAAGTQRGRGVAVRKRDAARGATGLAARPRGGRPASASPG